MTRVLLVDDDPAGSAALVAALGCEFSLKAVPDGEELERSVREFLPAVILLDINLPGRNGLKLLQAIQPLCKEVAVIMVSVRGADADIVRAFELGACDYVTKPFSLAVLRARIRRSLCVRPTENKIELGRVTLDLDAGRILDAGQPVPLTRKELLVLRCLLANAGWILTRDQLLDFAWGYDYHGTGRTVDNVIAELRKKLRDGDNVPPLLSSHRGLGYRLDVPARRGAGG